MQFPEFVQIKIDVKFVLIFIRRIDVCLTLGKNST
jgi:hypothetical protein